MYMRQHTCTCVSTHVHVLRAYLCRCEDTCAGVHGTVQACMLQWMLACPASDSCVSPHAARPHATAAVPSCRQATRQPDLHRRRTVPLELTAGLKNMCPALDPNSTAVTSEAHALHSSKRLRVHPQNQRNRKGVPRCRAFLCFVRGSLPSLLLLLRTAACCSPDCKAPQALGSLGIRRHEGCYQKARATMSNPMLPYAIRLWPFAKYSALVFLQHDGMDAVSSCVCGSLAVLRYCAAPLLPGSLFVLCCCPALLLSAVGARLRCCPAYLLSSCGAVSNVDPPPPGLPLRPHMYRSTARRGMIPKSAAHATSPRRTDAETLHATCDTGGGP
eukprot:357540-Chlamydomonas_euryale.AAC.1